MVSMRKRWWGDGCDVRCVDVGLTTIKIEVANPADLSKKDEVRFLVDSGAVYSVVPATVLRRLGIKSFARDEFTLADGSPIIRRRGGAFFRYGDRKGMADVIFGEPGDSLLLGALTLEALGLSLDPLRRELRPLPMILAGLPEPSKPTTRHRARQRRKT